MNSAGRALEVALAASLALCIIDIAKVILYGDGAELADLHALAASDAGRLAGLSGDSALVFVHTADINPAGVLRGRAGVAQFNYTLGAGLDAGAAGSTLAFVHDGQAAFRIEAQGAELAGSHAVAATQAAIRAEGVAAIEGSLHLEGRSSVVVIDSGAVSAASVAAHHSHLGSLCRDLIPKDGSHLGHRVIASDRTEIVVEIGSLDSSLGKSAATRKSAAAAVGTRHHFLHLIDSRVLLHAELSRHPEKHQGEQNSKQSQNRNSPDNSVRHCCTVYIIILLFQTHKCCEGGL